MSQSKSSNNNAKPKRVRWYFKLHLRSEPHEHVFFGEPTTHATAPYLLSNNSKGQDIELDPFQDVDEESGWWFLLATSNENLNYRLQSASEQGHRRANTPRNFPVKGQLSLSLYYEIAARSTNGQLAENKIKKSESNSNEANDEDDEREDEGNSKESESEIIGNAEEIGRISDKKLTGESAEEILDTKDMFTAYQLPLEDYSITLDPDLAETASPPKSKKRPTRTCQVEFTRQKKGLCGVFHVDFQRSEGKTDHCVALFDNDTIVAVRLFVPMAYLPEEFKKENESELAKKQTRKIKFLEEDKLVEVHFINNKLAPAYHMSQDGIVDEKVQEVIEPERMTVPELKESLKERNLSTEGVKKDLVKRLTAALNIGTCFKTEDESKSEETNGKKGSKKKTVKATKKKAKKAVEKLDVIAEEQDEEKEETESATNKVEKEDEKEEKETEVKEEKKSESKPKPKGKKKATKKKKGKAKKKVEEKQESADDTDKNESSGSQEDIMGSPIFPSALYNDEKMTDVHQQELSNSATEAKIEVTEPATKKSTTKKGKSPKKSPAKKAAKTSDVTEASPETESDSSGVSQGSSQGSNGDKSNASSSPEEPEISTPKRAPKKGRGKKSPSKSKVTDETEQNVDKMEVEEKNVEVINEAIISSQNSDKNSSQEIASNSPKKKGQKRKREETDSNVPIENNGSEDQEPQPKRRRLSRSKDEVLPPTLPQSLTQSL